MRSSVSGEEVNNAYYFNSFLYCCYHSSGNIPSSPCFFVRFYCSHRAIEPSIKDRMHTSTRIPSRLPPARSYQSPHYPCPSSSPFPQKRAHTTLRFKRSAGSGRRRPDPVPRASSRPNPYSRCVSPVCPCTCRASRRNCRCRRDISR